MKISRRIVRGISVLAMVGGCDSQDCTGAGFTSSYVVAFAEATDETGCTVRVTETVSGQTRDLACELRFSQGGDDVCACFGSARAGQYTVRVYDEETDVLLDEALIQVGTLSNGCPAPAEFVDEFDGFGGLGGMGGSSDGNASLAGAGGSP